MADIIKTILLRVILLPIAGVLCSRTAFAIAHANGWYPEHQLAGLLMSAPTAFQIEWIQWGLVALLALALWAIADYLLYRRRGRPRTRSSASDPPATTKHRTAGDSLELFQRRFDVSRIWIQTPKLASDGVIHLNINAFNGNDEIVYLTGINGRIEVKLEENGQRDERRVAPLVTPTFYELRRIEVAAFMPFHFAIAQPVPKNMAEQLEKSDEKVKLILDFEKLNIIAQSSRDPNKRVRLPLWDAGVIERSNGRMVLNQEIRLAPGRPMRWWPLG